MQPPLKLRESAHPDAQPWQSGGYSFSTMVLMKETTATRIGVAMLGHGFMGGIHSRALRAIGVTTWPVAAVPVLLSICGQNPETTEMARRRYGWECSSTDWRDQLDDSRVTLFVNAAPTALHVEPTLEALRLGKHVFCEKPLAVTANEAHTLWSAATAAGVVHACGFNYRFFPALALARQLIQRGDLGDIRRFRSRFFVPNTPSRDAGAQERFVRRAGDATRSVASHHIDAARFLVGEISCVFAHLASEDAAFEPGDRHECTVQALLTFENGASGTLEAALVSTCPAVESIIEVDGSLATMRFSLQTLNTLEVSTRAGRRMVSVADPADPFMEHWYPFGHPIGWGDSFVHEMANVLQGIAEESDVPVLHATFEDGYRCAEICDSIFVSARERRPVTVCCRTATGDVADPKTGR